MNRKFLLIKRTIVAYKAESFQLVVAVSLNTRPQRAWTVTHTTVGLMQACSDGKLS